MKVLAPSPHLSTPAPPSTKHKPTAVDSVDHPLSIQELRAPRQRTPHLPIIGPQRRKFALRASIIGATAIPLITAPTWYTLVPKWPTDDTALSPTNRHDVKRFAAMLDIVAPLLYVHHSLKGSETARSWTWPPRLIAVHEDVAGLFTPPALTCILAHEVAHFCERTLGAKPCRLPESFPFYNTGHPFVQREFKADYLASLVCGKEAMLEALNTLGEHHGFNHSSLTHPSLADRIDILSRSNETWFAGETGGDNPFDAAFSAAPKALGLLAAYMAYKWFKAKRRDNFES